MMERKMQDKPYPQRRRTPSFSSTLLDAIYNSIDESKSNLDENPQLGLFNQTTHNSKNNSKLSYKFNYNHGVYVEKSVNKEKMNHHRAIMIEDWMEKQSSKSYSHFINSSTSSSSGSSNGAMFSSSETDTTHKQSHQKRNSEKNQQKQKPQREGGFARSTKLRALKIYGELNQKVKQPISPGSRIASFISSIFNSAGNVKKAKRMCYVGAVEDVSCFEHKYSSKSSSSSPCFSSSVSSFSRRSCMSKTPGKKSNNGVKRCVRFYPVSVILGEEDSHSSRSVRKMTRSSSIKEVKKNSKENGAEVAACGFIKGYQNCDRSSSKFGFRGFYGNGELDECDEDDDDEDALSYSSSDLFELDHLIGAAAGRYQEELPVYETTNLETNKAIANGLRL